MQRKKENYKQKKSNKFSFSWEYLGKPTVPKKMSLDEMIDDWLKESKERLKNLDLEEE